MTEIPNKRFFIIYSCIILSIFLLTASCFNSKVKTFRRAFDQFGENMNKDLEKHIPPDSKVELNVQYIPNDTDAFLDIYYPPDTSQNWMDNPTIVWIHGGGWMAGSKEQIANYAKILSHKGFVVVNVGYALAPEKIHPNPARQINSALSFLLANAERFKLNKQRIVIAGDSGGANIAAQVGIVQTDPVYAKKLSISPALSSLQLAGIILYCGTYDFEKAEKDKEGLILRMMMRAYCGHKNYDDDPMFALGSVINFIPTKYPPTFISTGNQDPLKKHSYSLADTLAVKGIAIDTLFWETKSDVSLGHEYQFNLDDESGKIALQRTVEFLEMLEM